MDITSKLLPLFVILLSGFLVAAADGLIKHISVQTSNIWSTLTNPLMVLVGIMYIFAIWAFSFAFIRHWDLGIVGLLQIIIYAAAVVLLGIFFFQEKLTLVHGIGMILAVAAAILMNI